MRDIMGSIILFGSFLLVIVMVGVLFVPEPKKYRRRFPPIKKKRKKQD